jgi:hypothetical protein
VTAAGFGHTTAKLESEPSSQLCHVFRPRLKSSRVNIGILDGPSRKLDRIRRIELSMKDEVIPTSSLRALKLSVIRMSFHVVTYQRLGHLFTAITCRCCLTELTLNYNFLFSCCTSPSTEYDRITYLFF